MTPDGNKDVLNTISCTIEALETLDQLFPAQNNHPEDMLILYSLISHHRQNPNRLVDLIDHLQGGDIQFKRFFLTYISRLLDKEERLEDIKGLIELCKEDSEKFNTLKAYCSFPPYPLIENAKEWLEQNSFKDNYEQFSNAPYGERVLDFTFNLSHYKRQRSKFKGVSDNVLTDELGHKLNQELQANRSKSIVTLREELNQLHGKTFASAEDKRKALGLCVEFLARTACQASPGSQEGVISQELNTSQIMTLYAMMMQDNPKILNQIDTGEGKSRIMMVLAALNALQGKTVDFITSDIQLAERDYFNYQQFFNALNVRTGFITLQTPAALYQKGGVNFSDNAQLLLLRNKSDITGSPDDYLEKERSNRCLLVDEVDHFKHDKNKDAFNYAGQSQRLSGYTWIYPLLVQFMQDKLDPEHPHTLPTDEHGKLDFQALRQPFMTYVAQHDTNESHLANLDHLNQEQSNQLFIWLQSAYTALNMKSQKDYVVSDKDDKKRYAVRDQEGLTRYTRKVLVLDHGRPVEGSTFADGVHQCLCAIENEKAGSEQFLILPENETQRSSYAQTFISQYDNIFGVSGTTRSEAPLSNQLINKDNYHYLITPREKPLIREDLNVWAAKDETQQISFIKRDILKAVKENKSVLLACRDDQQSKTLKEALFADESLQKAITKWQYLHGLTSTQDEKDMIKNAGTPGCLTVTNIGLSGRGVHINTKNMQTIAAFTPSVSDEIQLKGRSGRFGQPGSYRMIVNLSDPLQKLNGKTYNIANEVDKVQKDMAISAAPEEEVSAVYSNFLENIHQAFLREYQNTRGFDQLTMLNDWQAKLGELQQDWERQRPALLTQLEADNQDEFKKQFKAFANKWVKTMPGSNDLAKEQTLNNVDDNASKAYQSYHAQKGFFKHKPLPLTAQRHYDPADDGQARIYTSLFAQSKGALKGERALFANLRAWKEERGVLFPELKATLRGERPLFANLRATIAHLIDKLKNWYQNKFDSDLDNATNGHDALPNTM